MVRFCGTCAPALVLLAVSALAAGPVWAGPYDNPYGIQWNFQIGNNSADNPSSLAASPDGTVWIATQGQGKGGELATWGQTKSGAHHDGGYGQINAYGQIMQGNDTPHIPDAVGQNQMGPAGITMRGTTAYYAWTAYNANHTWDNQVPDQNPSPGNPMTVSIATVATPQGTPYDNAAGLGHKYNMQLLSTGGGVSDSVVASDGSMYFSGQNQGGDKFTVGDYTGIAGSGYNPWVGKVAADGATLSGPAQQPNCDSVRTYCTDISINEGTGRVYATGYNWPRENVGTFFDPDGSGPLLHTFAATTLSDRGWGMVYDSSWNLVHDFFWESNYGGEGVYDNIPTADGGVILVGETRGDMPGQPAGTNPAPGTSDIYIAKYDAAGNMVWDYQSGTAASDMAGDVTLDPDGNVYVSGTRNTGADDDPILMKFTADGALVWTSVIDNAGSQEYAVDHGNIDKNKIYVLSENNPSVGGVWPNTTGYVPQGTDEVLLQKLSPGDFDTDGDVDWDDMTTAMNAVAGGPLAVDTYDFDGDGDSDSDDVDYFMQNIFDSEFGDFDWDGVVEDGLEGRPDDDALLLMGWTPGPTRPQDPPGISLPAGWRGFAGPNTPGLIDFEEWDYLFDLEQPPPEGDVPEPATLGLLGLAACGLGGYVRRRRKA